MTEGQAAVRQLINADVALGGIYEISKLLVQPNRLENTLAGVLALLSSFLDMRHGLIALLDQDGNPTMVVGSGWSEASAKRYFDRLPEQAVGRIVVTKMPLVVTDVRSDPLFADSDISRASMNEGCSFAFLGVPIKEGDKVIGTLTIDRAHAGRLSMDGDVRFLTMIANLVGQTLTLHKVVARDRDRLMEEQARLEKERTKELPAVKEIAHPRAQPETSLGIIGNSPAIRAVVDKVNVVAKSRSTILLRGETGTGKEMFATAIHSLSPRRNGPFVKLNCAALPESVLESELFGHEKGAFTGAVVQRKGRFELADGGTLFLDEIGEISPTFQAKLLRVLQEGEFERVGSSRPIKVDVRLVCATNRNLEEAVVRGEFRSDLYYRISVVPVFLPPLRERRGDMPLLAREFLERFNHEHGTELNLSPEALSVLAACYFPGNIRELENCIRRTATLVHGKSIRDTDFACHNDSCLSAMLWKGNLGVLPHPIGFTPLPIASTVASAAPRRAETLKVTDAVVESSGDTWPIDCPAPDGCPVVNGDPRSERERLVEAMETAGWVQAKAARLLGLTPRQIGYALRKHNVPIKKF